ncbi:MAG: GNAT family N-acetyltransferase [Cellulomonas sp.]|nr:GNAT family N-acetyltransferase [Cellulomonas sp.]
MTVLVRSAGPADAAALAALAAVTFPLACPPSTSVADQQAFLAEHLSTERFVQYLADPARDILVGDDGSLLGYVMTVAGEPADPQVASAVRARPCVELSKCYAHPDAHGTGLAAQLVAAAATSAARRGATVLWLGVNVHNERARRFYTKAGFVLVGTKQFVVGSRTEDDVVMERTIG